MKKLITLLLFCGSFLLSNAAATPDIATLNRKAQGGDIDSMFQLAQYYEKTDSAKAVEFYKKAAAKEHADAAFRLGNWYLTGSFDTPDLTALAHLPDIVYNIVGMKIDSYYERDQKMIKDKLIQSLKKGDLQSAFKYYTLACEFGHVEAKYVYGVLMLQEGLGVQRYGFFRYRYMTELFRPAAEENNNAAAWYFLGVCYTMYNMGDRDDIEKFNGIFKDEKSRGRADEYLSQRRFTGRQDLTAAQNAFIKSSGLHFAPAQHYLGKSYQIGKLFIQSYEESAKYYTLAAEQAHADARYRLALYFLDGVGVSRNPEKAVELLTLAAGQNHADAQYKLALCLTDGTGTEKNLPEAAKYFKAAADNRHIGGEYRYAVCCRDGLGIEKDPVQAREYFQWAAKGNHPEAQYQLGLCFANGYGGNKDLETAAKWIFCAGEKDHAKALCAFANYCASGSFDDPDLTNIREFLANAAARYRKQHLEYFNSAEIDAEKWLRDRSVRFVDKINSKKEFENHNSSIWAKTSKKSTHGGYYYAHNVEPQTFGTARAKYAPGFYGRAAKNGSAEAQFIYGIAMLEGMEIDITPEHLKKFFSLRRETMLKKDPQTAELWLKEAAKQNLAIADYELARIYIRRNRKNELVTAQKKLQAIAGKYAPAKFLLAAELASGKNFTADPEKAETLFQELFTADVQSGMQIAKFYASINQRELAAKWFDKCITANLKGAQYEAGLFFDSINDHEKAKAAFEAAAKEDIRYAGMAANYYLNTRKESASAAPFLEKTASSKDPEILYALVKLLNDSGDPEEFRQLKSAALETAANAGHHRAEYLLAKTIIGSDGASSGELQNAVLMLTKAAESNFHPAQTLLAKCYVSGTGVSIDLGKAVSWFEKAIYNGSGEACFQMAQCYITGNWNKDKNLKTAIDLLFLGSQREDADCSRQLANYLIFQTFDDPDPYTMEDTLQKIKSKYESIRKEQYQTSGFNTEKCSQCNGNSEKKVKGCAECYLTDEELKKINEAPEEMRAKQRMIILANKRQNFWRNVYFQQRIDHLDILEYRVVIEPLITWNDYKWALLCYGNAADHGNPVCSYIIALSYYYGFADYLPIGEKDGKKIFTTIPMLKKDFSRAVTYLRNAAGKGNFHASYYLGLCYLRGTGVEKNTDEALKHLITAAEKGHQFARRELGYYFKSIKKYNDSARFFRLAAENGDKISQFELAELYRLELVGKDPVEMIKWYHLAALQGHRQSQNELRKFYSAADPELKDDNAYTWYRKAADNQDHIAQYILAICHKYGTLEKKDPHRAAVNFELAAYQGVVDAQYETFRTYITGEGIKEPDKTKAAGWLKKAAVSGDFRAIYFYAANKLLTLDMDFKDLDLKKHDLAKIPQESWKDEELIKLLAKAADLQNGILGVQYFYAYYLMYIKKDELDKAAKLFCNAAVKDIGNARFEVIMAFSRDLIPFNSKSLNPKMALNWLKKAYREVRKMENKQDFLQRLDYVNGCFFLYGYAYEKDIKNAYKYLSKASEQNYGNALYKLAQCYKTGVARDRRGSYIGKNPSKALEYLQKCEYSFPAAKYELAESYYRQAENSVRKHRRCPPQKNCTYCARINDSYREAFYRFQQCAQNKYAPAYVYLGLCYRDGKGGVYSSEYMAAYYFDLASQADIPEGHYLLAQCLLDGKGVAKDRERAVTLLQQAADEGHAQAARELKKLQ